MSYFKAKMHQIRPAGAPDSTGELTALPKTPELNLRGLLLKERNEKKEERRREREVKGKWKGPQVIVGPGPSEPLHKHNVNTNGCTRATLNSSIISE